MTNLCDLGDTCPPDVQPFRGDGDNSSTSLSEVSNSAMLKEDNVSFRQISIRILLQDIAS